MALIKKRVGLILLLFSSLSSLAQHDEEKADATDYIANYIAIPSPKQKMALPFSGIEVYDARFDTSCLGIISRSPATQLNLLSLEKGIPAEIKNYCLSSIEIAGKDKPVLYCFIKKLVLSNHVPTPDTEEMKELARQRDADKWSGILFRAEFYCRQDDHYIPVCRFDTTIVGIEPINRAGGIYLAGALTAGLYKTASFNAEKMGKQGKKLTREDINQFNAKRFAIPILYQPPAKGIYLNFADFLNNTPSNREFRLDKNKTGDFLYTKNKNGEDSLLTELWGYSDGKDMYIFSASNYFKLQRTGNGFKIYGAKDFTSRRNLRPNFGLIDAINPNSNSAKGQTRNKYYLVKNYFQLDMETGELY